MKGMPPNSIKFFHFPKIDRRTKTFEALSTTRRKMWCKVLGVTDQKRFDYHVVCAYHFVTGQSAKLNEDGHVDWVPSLYLTEEAASRIPRNGPKKLPHVQVPSEFTRRQFDYTAPALVIDDDSDDSYEYDITEMVKDRQEECPQQSLIIGNNTGIVQEVRVDFTNGDFAGAYKDGKIRIPRIPRN